MPKAYSGDLRVRVIEMVQAGASRREAAEEFSVAGSTAVKWLQRWEESGSAEAKPRGGSISPLEVHATVILEVVRAQPDAAFVELLVVLKKRGIRTSRSALWRFFGRHDITFKKKSLCASERQRQDVARARRKWIREQGLVDPARLVFIDETSVNTQMVRLYGHVPRGVRLVDHVPFGNRKTFTFVAALRHNRMVAPLLIDGAMNGEIFRAYIEQFVVPILKPNDIVAIDNLPAHNVAGIEEMINASEPRCAICGNIHPTSTRSNCPTANLRRTCASLPHAPSPASTAPSARSCTSSSRGNAPIITNT